MATLQGKAVKNTYRQVLQIGANNVGVSGALQPVQDGAGVNTALSLSTAAATINGTLTITGDLIITGGGIQITDLIDDTVASLIQNGTGITWAYNDTLRTLTPTITIATADGGVQGDFMQLNTGAGEANAVAKIYWNSSEGTADLGLLGGQVILPIGQKQVARVLNNSGSIFNKSAYQVVKITAAQGQRLAVGLAQANNDANSTDTLGLVAENIANNQEGFITTSGLITNVDTTGDLQLEDWNDGDILYLSPTTPGAITKVKPIAPQHTVIVGFVVYAHKNNGKIYVKVDNGYELDELHNVRITSVANNNVLRYNSSLAVWENVAPLTTWITEGTNLYYTQGRFDSAFAAKSTTNLAEGTNLYWTTARGDVNFSTNLAASTTTNLAEGTNLYFTNQRFDSRFGTKTTTDLAEGTNLYYTQTRFNTAFDAKTTTDLDEGTNLYYTDARSRAAISENAVGLDYSSGSGVLSLTSGYAIPTTVKLGQYDTAYNRSIVSAAVTGTGTKTLSLTQQDANVVTATWTDQGITTINGTANQIAATTVGNTTTLAFTNDVTMPNNLVVSGNLTINGTATYVNTQAISAKDPLFEVANDNNTTDAVDIGYYGRYFDSAQTRVEFTGLFRDASDAGKFKFFTGLTVEPTNVVDTTGTGYTVGTLVANVEGNLAGTANAANQLSTARSISATGDAAWTVNFDGSANATAALTLANTGVTATTYGTTTSVPTIAVDAKGRITSASNTNIAFPVTTVNGFSGTVVLTTSDVAEGTNQYFTSARAQASITGGASSVVTANLTASRALVSDGSGKIAASASTTATEVSYLAGVTSAIQTQLNSKLNLSGGTLTGGLSGTTLGLSGALTGTSAAFSGNVNITANNILNEGVAASIIRQNGANGNNGLLVDVTNSVNAYIADFRQGNSSLVRITGAGNVGIGTTSPNFLVQVNKSDGGASVTQYTNADTGSASTNGLLCGIDSAENGLFFHQGAKALRFGTSDTERLTIASTGVSTFTVAGNDTRLANFSTSTYGSARGLRINTYTSSNGGQDCAVEFDSGVATYGGFRFSNSGTPMLTLAASGAATFTSSINTNTFLSLGTGSGKFLAAGNTVTGGSTADMLLYNTGGDLIFWTTGAVGMTLKASTGNLGIGTSSPSSLLHLSSSSNTAQTITSVGAGSYASISFFNTTTGYGYDIGFGGSSTIAPNSFYIYGGSTASVKFSINATGIIQSAATYNNTTGLGANMQIDSNGFFARSTSSIKYKKNVENYTKGLAEVMQMRPVTYNSINETETQTYAGLIAEEIHELGLTEYVQYAEDGTPDALSYGNMVALAFKAIQELKAEIEELKAK